jgi:hypothetical protein
MELEYVNFALRDILTMFIELIVLWWDKHFTNRKFPYFSFTTPLIHYNLSLDCAHKE